jgi:CubicO group peptidase (beta-lactamase class C family)
VTAAGFLKTTAQRVRGVLEDHVARGYATGMVALIGRGDEVEAVSVGAKALGGGDPMRRDTLFRIASMTKPITAAAGMMLVEEGKLTLDEPVDRLLPELADRRVLARIDGAVDDTVAAKRPITVEDVMSFRLGLGLIMAPPGAWPIQRAIAGLGLVGFGPPDPASPIDPDDWMARLGTLPLMAQPGEAWLYTTASNVLGVMIARASGQSLPAFLHARIFEPLGMKDTAFYAPPAKHDRLASAYRRVGAALELIDAAETSAYGAPPAFPAGDAGLVSTVDDMFAFSRLLLNLGRVGDRQLLSKASVRAMTTDHLTSAQRAGGSAILGPGRGWGHGGMAIVLEATAEGAQPGAYGWNGGFGTSWLVDPRTETVAILMTQTMFDGPDPPAVHKDFQRAVFGMTEG